MVSSSWRPTPHRPYTLGINAPQLVVLSFLAFIALGTLLLLMPAAHPGKPHVWVDALFMATSAVCVTGLYTVDPATTYGTLGQWLLMGLVQIGGLGYMTLFTISLILIGKRVSLRDRLALQEVTEHPGLGGLLGFARSIVVMTLAIEGIGAFLLAFRLVPRLGWAHGFSQSLFHAVMAFNNAGFPLVPGGAMRWQGDIPVLLVLAALTILGGLGFTVNRELFRRWIRGKRGEPRWDVLVRLVLSLTGALLAIGTLAIWGFEHANPQTLAPLPQHLQWANAFFMSVQPRTAGFNSVDVGLMRDPTLLITVALMAIGGAPGGTAGGVKLTSLAVITATIVATIRGQNDVTLFRYRRRLGEKTIRRALTQVTLSTGVIGLASIALVFWEPYRFLAVLFEVTSAFSTVGLSTGITSQLSVASKLVLSATMLIGRVGVMTLLLALVTERRQSSVRWGEENLLIG